MSRAQVRAPAPVRVVFDGQSMNWFPFPPYNMPTFAMSGTQIPYEIVAVSGTGWSELQDTIATRVHPQARNRDGCVDILVMNGGQSDILDTSLTGAELYDVVVDYATSAKAAGFTHVILATLPDMGADVQGDVGRPTEAEYQVIADFNELAIANSGEFDAVVDISSPPFDDAENPIYYRAEDRLHWTVTGAQEAATRFTEAIVSVL